MSSAEILLFIFPFKLVTKESVLSKKGRRGPFFGRCYRFFGFPGRTNIGTGLGQTWAKLGTEIGQTSAEIRTTFRTSSVLQ